jgi:hypothetical protein
MARRTTAAPTSTALISTLHRRIECHDDDGWHPAQSGTEVTGGQMATKAELDVLSSPRRGFRQHQESTHEELTLGDQPADAQRQRLALSSA